MATQFEAPQARSLFDSSTLAVLAANGVALAGVYFGGWRLSDVVAVYAAEVAIVVFWHLLRCLAIFGPRDLPAVVVVLVAAALGFLLFGYAGLKYVFGRGFALSLALLQLPVVALSVIHCAHFLASWIKSARRARAAGGEADAQAVALAEKEMLLAVSGGLALRILLSILFQILAVTVFRAAWSAGAGLLFFSVAKTISDVAGQTSGQYLRVGSARTPQG